MKIANIQSYNLQTTKNRQQNINFTALNKPSSCSKRGCGLFMALSILTTIGTITAPLATYDHLSKNNKDKTIVNILTSIGAGAAAFGAGCASIFFAKGLQEKTDDNE